MVRNQACIGNSAFPLALVFKSNEWSIPCPTRGVIAFQKTRSSGQTKIMCTLRIQYIKAAFEKLFLSSFSTSEKNSGAFHFAEAGEAE